jgi:SAM-dependent methyltransferase
MDLQDFTVAADFCRLVGSPDLLAYLGLPADVPGEIAIEALSERRKHMQAMQANPKFKDSARALIKGYQPFQRLLSMPNAYRDQVARAAEAGKLPLLELVIDGVLADGQLTAAEEVFVRDSAGRMGISDETFQRVLAARTAMHGVVRSTEIQGAAGYAWWDATFTRVLLELIPQSSGTLVDIYCRDALSAVTILPVRPQLSYIGVDKSAERLESARAALPDVPNRMALVQAEPHALPMPDESVDLVLAVRMLGNQPDAAAVLEESARILRPGGRVVIAEPDGLGASFYFDGALANYNAWFHRLVADLDARVAPHLPPMRRPGLALGPALHARLAAAGLRPLSTTVHAASTLRPRPFGRFVARLQRYPEQIAATMGLEGGEALDGIRGAIASLEIDPETVGLGGQVLPLFLAVAVKD